MYLRRFLFTLFALALAPPGFAQSLAKNFTLNGANQCATIGVSDLATVGITVTGTFSATLQPEVSIAGQSPGNTQVTPTTSNTAQATITTTGNYVAAVAGFDTFLLCVSSYASGTANVYLNPSGAVNASVIGGGGGGLAWNLNQNATGNLLLQNGTHTTTFQQTAAEPWQWANTTAATSSTPQDSPIWELEGTWWNASLASAVDGWSLEDVPGTSTTMASGLVSHCAETSGVVTLTGSGMPVFAANQAALTVSPAGTGATVTFAGFTTCTWLNGLPVALLTNTSSSITFNDPTNHANQGSVAEAAVTGSSAQSTLTLQQLAGSAPVGVFQLSNPQPGTAVSVNASPAVEFATNTFYGGASNPEKWDCYSRGISGGNAASSLICNYKGNPADVGSFIISGTGNSSSYTPNLGFYHNNAGVMSNDAFLGVLDSDGTTYNFAFTLQTVASGIAMTIGGASGATAGSDVDMGSSTNVQRTNTVGPNYGVVLSGLYLSGSPGFGGETFAPASGASKNFAVWSGGKFNPTTGTSSFVGLNVTPILTGTTSGNTAALSVDPQLTATNLTGTNCQQTWHDGTATGTTPGTLLVCMDYSGVLIPSVIYSAAGTAIPACNTARKGGRTVVSDATTPTFLGTYTSGGAVVSPVMCNGTNWVTY